MFNHFTGPIDLRWAVAFWMLPSCSASGTWRVVSPSEWLRGPAKEVVHSLDQRFQNRSKHSQNHPKIIIHRASWRQNGGYWPLKDPWFWMEVSCKTSLTEGPFESIWPKQSGRFLNAKTQKKVTEAQKEYMIIFDHFFFENNNPESRISYWVGLRRWLLYVLWRSGFLGWPLCHSMRPYGLGSWSHHKRWAQGIWVDRKGKEENLGNNGKA